MEEIISFIDFYGIQKYNTRIHMVIMAVHSALGFAYKIKDYLSDVCSEASKYYDEK